MMKRLTTPLLLTLLLLPLSVVAQSEFYRNLTKNIRTDLTRLADDFHSRRRNSVLLKDLQTLDYHLNMQNDMTMNELTKLKVLELYEEYFDLKMACHYTMAAIYHQQGDSLKTSDALSDAVTYSKPSYKRCTPLQQLIVLTTDYLDNFPYKVGDVMFSKSSVGSRVSIMKDVLSMRISLTSLLEEPIPVSLVPLVNELLAYDISILMPTWKMTSKALTSDLTTQMAQLMAYAADLSINLWVEEQYPAQFVVDDVKAGKFGGLTNQTNESKCLRELAVHGFGPASHLLGLRCELGSHGKENPELAFQFYELAAEQGCKAGIIRKAHCLAVGYGCKANAKEAFALLKPLRDDVDFPRYGAYAYARLAEQGIGGKADMAELMVCYTLAASEAVRKSELQAAQERIAELYEKYYP